MLEETSGLDHLLDKQLSPTPFLVGRALAKEQDLFWPSRYFR